MQRYPGNQDTSFFYLELKSFKLIFLLILQHAKNFHKGASYARFTHT